MEPRVDDAGTVSAAPGRDRVALPSVIRELLVVVVGYGAYTFVRKATTGGETAGLRNARQLAHWEDVLHLDMERSVNGFFSDHRWLAAWSGWY